MSRLRWWRQLHNATISHAARSKRNTRIAHRESRPATRDSRLSIGASCVCALFQLSSHRVASRRVFCFVISSHLISPHLAVAAVFKATCSSSGRRGRNFLHDTCSSSSSGTKKQSRRIRKLLADFSRCYRVALRRPRRVNKNNKQCAAHLSYSEIERDNEKERQQE